MNVKECQEYATRSQADLHAKCHREIVPMLIRSVQMAINLYMTSASESLACEESHQTAVMEFVVQWLEDRGFMVESQNGSFVKFSWDHIHDVIHNPDPMFEVQEPVITLDNCTAIQSARRIRWLRNMQYRETFEKLRNDCDSTLRSAIDRKVKTCYYSVPTMFSGLLIDSSRAAADLQKLYEKKGHDVTQRSNELTFNMNPILGSSATQSTTAAVAAAAGAVGKTVDLRKTVHLIHSECKSDSSSGVRVLREYEQLLTTPESRRDNVRLQALRIFIISAIHALSSTQSLS